MLSVRSQASLLDPCYVLVVAPCVSRPKSLQALACASFSIVVFESGSDLFACDWLSHLLYCSVLVV